MLTKWFNLYVEFYSIHQVTSLDWVQDYLEVISMDQASMSTKSMMISSTDYGCWVSKPHRASLQDPSFYTLFDFVIFMETSIMANFVIM